MTADAWTLDLDSPNWVRRGDVFYWASTGPSEHPPLTALRNGNFDSINANWAAVLVSNDELVLVEDVVRSHPLFYARVEGRWVVTDRPELMRQRLPHWQRNERQASVFPLIGYALNEETLVQGVSSVEAASRVGLPRESSEPSTLFWGIPQYAAQSVGDAERFERLYLEAIESDFRELLARVQARQLVVPLSGGVDSRLVAALLKKLGAENVLAFTYGMRGSPEVKVSKSVADALGIPWIFIEFDLARAHRAWFSEESASFRADTWSASALPHIQDWFALREAARLTLFQPGAVVVPGHTAVGAMHNEELLAGNASGKEVARAIADHHFLGRPSTRALEKNQEFRRAIKRTAEQVPPGPRRVQSFVEWFNVRERQAKYINNSMSAYEHFGWDWALPLYWPRSLDAWLSGSESLTATRGWYRSFVDRIFVEQAGGSTESAYFEAPAEAVSAGLGSRLVKLARATGANRPLNWVWSMKTQMRHPEGFHVFTAEQSPLKRLGRLLRERNLMGLWAKDFLAGRWGRPGESLVPEARVETEASRRKLLVISYSPIARDARVLKQIALFSKEYDVTVVGHGQPFDTDAELILYEPADNRWTDRLRALLLHLRLYRLAHWFEAENVVARRLLRKMSATSDAGDQFDAVLTNDLEPVGLALQLFGADRVHADLHEYYPGLQDNDPAWVKLRQPYYRWMLKNQAAKAASCTTVSQTIADRYQREFGLQAEVVENARPDSRLSATEVGEPIRLVHAGAALPNRHIEQMMRAVAATDNLTLDLYLTGQGTAYRRTLEQLASELGEKVAIHSEIAPDDLVATLNQFDVGLHVLPPEPTNNLLALPNKFFDFVQARLAVVVGPSPEMERRVREFELGVVADDFTETALARALQLLDRESVRVWKSNSARAASSFDVSRMLPRWSRSIDKIVLGGK